MKMTSRLSPKKTQKRSLQFFHCSKFLVWLSISHPFWVLHLLPNHLTLCYFFRRSGFFLLLRPGRVCIGILTSNLGRDEKGCKMDDDGCQQINERRQC